MISTTAWGLTICVVLGLCALEVGLAHRRPATPSPRAAVLWSLFYVAVALAFGVVLAVSASSELAGEYFAGFVVEKSLSVDNLFVFVIILGSFAVPPAQRSRALTLGIVSALVLRCAFIALGAALISSFSVTFAIFGVILVVTAVQLIRHRGQTPQAHGTGLARALRRRLPISDGFHGGRLLIRVNGTRLATPMLLVLIVMGAVDALFALDSIPAVYGVTDDPFIVFAANAFALLGMRPLFFLVTGLLDRLIYLSEGMAAILAFIGLKLILEFLHGQLGGVPEVGTPATLGVIAVILALAAGASLVTGRRDRRRIEDRIEPQMGARPHGQAPRSRRSSSAIPSPERTMP